MSTTLHPQVLILGAAFAGTALAQELDLLFGRELATPPGVHDRDGTR